VKKSIKAALISAFIFPGLGHIYLKKYLVGILLAGISGASIYYMISNVMEIAMEISKKIQSGAIPPDIATITALVSQQANAANTQLTNIATSVFFICWSIAILDSYRLGIAQEKCSEPVLDN